MTLTELQTLHLDVQNLLETVRLAEVFNLAQDLPFCKGFEKYKNDFLNSHFPHNFDIFCQQLGLFLNQCFENEIEIKKLEQESSQNATIKPISQTDEAKKWLESALHATDPEVKAVAYNYALALNPQYAEAYFHRGLSKYEVRNYQGAKEDFDKAITFNPQYAEAYYHRGNAYYDLGEKREAIKDYTKAVELNPQLKDAYYNGALAYARYQDKENTLAFLKEAIQLDNAYKARATKSSAMSWLDEDTDFQALTA
jgi:tetratricopeptide (TPR) repeat protein